jgi:predicted DNA-binding transcriptional regulator AlpA
LKCCEEGAAVSDKPLILTGSALLIPDTAAAAMAGVSRATWHRLRAAGKLPPAVRLGRALRWRRRDVELWIDHGCPDGRAFAAIQASGRRRVS